MILGALAVVTKEYWHEISSTMGLLGGLGSKLVLAKWVAKSLPIRISPPRPHHPQ